MTAAPTDAAFHSVRLFPKNGGAPAYVLTGVAARCDWVFLSDNKPPLTHLHQVRPTQTPRHIFLSLRNPFAALSAFATNILPRLQAPFVLVSGSEDVTLPRQIDQRWRGYNESEQRQVRAILDHPLLIRWFAENLEDDSDPRFAPMPTGMVYPENTPDAFVPIRPPLQRARPLRILIGHRVRSGPQWELRRQISTLAKTAWAPFCTLLENEMPEQDFLALMQSHAFVLCAEGGGLDPSPKAWQTLLHGAIPIIRKTGTHQAYARLPVAFVEAWQADSLTPERLAAWRQKLAPFQDTSALRNQTLERLCLNYWWDQISALTYDPDT